MITSRLELRLGDKRTFAIAPEDREGLAAVLGVVVPEDWPVEHYDEGVCKWCCDEIDRDPQTPWLLRYVIDRDSNTLVGTCGSSKPEPAIVIIGYSILPAFRRRGFATEATAALVDFAFRDPAVERVVADTYPSLTASIGVLEKSGFQFAGAGDGDGVIRYERRRPSS